MPVLEKKKENTVFPLKVLSNLNGGGNNYGLVPVYPGILIHTSTYLDEKLQIIPLFATREFFWHYSLSHYIFYKKNIKT